MVQLVEECFGKGELLKDGRTIRAVEYRVQRYQGMSQGSGMPIPGLFRIEGAIESPDFLFEEWIGLSLGLKLEDGRVFGIEIIDENGRVLSEGHGPAKCLCC